MRYAKPFLTLGAAVLCAIPLLSQGADNDSVARARDELAKKLNELQAPAPAAPPKATAPAPKPVTPPPAPAPKPTVAKQPAVKPAPAPAPVVIPPSADQEAIAKARDAMRQKMDQLPAAQPAPAAYPAQPYPAQQPAYPAQGGYPPAQAAQPYPPPQSAYPAQGDYPPPQPAYPPQAYPPQAYPPPAYPPQAAYPPPAYGPRPQQRGSWYIGFGLGGGDGGLSDAGQSATFKEFLGKAPTTVSLNFKVGATLSPKTLVGFDVTAVRAEATEGSATAAIQVTNYDAMFTWFPMEKGLFLRGGGGLSAMTVQTDTGYSSGSETYTGVNLLAGVGYALWLGNSFNLTANFDYSAQSYGGSNAPDSSHIWQLYLGFDWY